MTRHVKQVTPQTVNHWRGLLEAARAPVETAQSEMQAYIDTRCPLWQQSEEGATVRERIKACAAALEALRAAEPEPMLEDTETMPATLPTDAETFLRALAAQSEQTLTPIHTGVIYSLHPFGFEEYWTASRFLEDAGYVITEGANTVALTEAGLKAAQDLAAKPADIPPQTGK